MGRKGTNAIHPPSNVDQREVLPVQTRDGSRSVISHLERKSRAGQKRSG